MKVHTSLLVAIILAVSLVSPLKASAMQELHPDLEVSYSFIEGTKMEYMTVDPIKNVRRWTKPDRLADYVWRIEKASSGKYKIRRHSDVGFYLFVSWDNSVGVARKEDKDFQEFEFQEWTIAEVVEHAPNLFHHVMVENASKPKFLEQVKFVSITTPSRNNDYVSVGSDGNILTWGPAGKGGKPSHTQIFAMKSESAITRQKTETLKLDSVPLKATPDKVVDSQGSYYSGDLKFVRSVKTHDLVPVLKQEPSVKLVVETFARHRQTQEKVYRVSLRNTEISASKSKKMAFDEDNVRGYFLESVEVEISSLTKDFKVYKSKPDTTSVDGTTAIESGYSFGTSTSVDTSGPSSGITASYSESVAYSTSFTNYSVEKFANPRNENSIRWRYYMSSVWMADGVTARPYSSQLDMVTRDQGPFEGYTLRHPTDMAIRTLPIVSDIIFTASPDKNGKAYQGKVKFKVKITLNLTKVESDNKLFDYYSMTDKAKRVIEQDFSFDFIDAEQTAGELKVKIVE